MSHDVTVLPAEIWFLPLWTFLDLYLARGQLPAAEAELCRCVCVGRGHLPFSRWPWAEIDMLLTWATTVTSTAYHGQNNDRLLAKGHSTKCIVRLCRVKAYSEGNSTLSFCPAILATSCKLAHTKFCLALRSKSSLTGLCRSKLI